MSGLNIQAQRNAKLSLWAGNSISFSPDVGVINWAVLSLVFIMNKYMTCTPTNRQKVLNRMCAAGISAILK